MFKATGNKLHISYLIMFNKCSLDAHFTCRKAATKVGLGLINDFWEHLPAGFWSLNKKTYLKQIACQEDECSSGACDCRFHGYILAGFHVAYSRTDMHVHAHTQR